MVLYAAIVGFIVLAVVARFAWAYFRLRGERVVTCPESKDRVGVSVSNVKAAAGAVLGRPSFAITECTHWPERHNCGQGCLAEIEHAPVDCLVRIKLAGWYAGKSCAICRRSVAEIDWYDRRPALLSPKGRPTMWQEVKGEQLDATLAAYKPICFDCYVAETFRKAHPGLVLDNPYAPPPPGRSA